MSPGLARLAKWRMNGNGVWLVRMRAYGYDDEYDFIEEGNLSATFVMALARRSVSNEIGCSLADVFVTGIYKES